MFHLLNRVQEFKKKTTYIDCIIWAVIQSIHLFKQKKQWNNKLDKFVR